SLDHHQTLHAAQLGTRIIPTFRPDALFEISAPNWRSEIERLGKISGREIKTHRDLVNALAERRAVFKKAGAVATDHGVLSPRTERLRDGDVDRLFFAAVRRTATAEDQAKFSAHMLMEMASQSTEDGLVMQL